MAFLNRNPDMKGRLPFYGTKEKKKENKGMISM
jgi:hypothetical protein